MQFFNDWTYIQWRVPLDAQGGNGFRVWNARVSAQQTVQALQTSQVAITIRYWPSFLFMATPPGHFIYKFLSAFLECTALVVESFPAQPFIPILRFPASLYSSILSIFVLGLGYSKLNLGEKETKNMRKRQSISLASLVFKYLVLLAHTPLLLMLPLSSLRPKNAS